MNESRVVSKSIEEGKERKISCFKDNIKGCETSKKDYGKQTLLQRNETKESSKTLQMKNDLSNTLKVLSKEKQDESTKLNESRLLSENIAEEKERKKSCLKVKNKELETSKEVFNNKYYNREMRLQIYM